MTPVDLTPADLVVEGRPGQVLPPSPREAGRATLVVASNRGPLSFEVAADGGFRTSRGSGGLVTGLTSAAAASGQSNALWIAAALSDGDRLAARVSGGDVDKVVADAGGDPLGVQVRLIEIDPTTLSIAYDEVANRTLWFAAHGLFSMPWAPSFGRQTRDQWESYRLYNKAFADAIAEEAAPGARVLVQDYHLFLVPGMLREKRPDLRIGHFTHTPWPAPDGFRWLPDPIARDLLLGLLGADRVAFHTARWARDFLSCCESLEGVEVGRDHVVVGHRRVEIAVHALGVEPGDLRAQAGSPEAAAWDEQLRADLDGRKMILRVDRTEPSKNILRGLEAFEELLESRPEWLGRVCLHAYCNPSRTNLPEYQDYSIAVHERVERINARYTSGGWTPVTLKVDADLPRALAAMRIADVVMVNPVRDGMNLVAKEAMVLSPGTTLVLSREAGAVEQLGADSLVVNPFDVTETAEALHAGLVMPIHERRARTRRLAERAAAHPPADWLAEQLDALS